MSQPPIVPGYPPEEPPPPYHHALPPQPMYYPPPPPASKADVVGKTAVGTFTVIAIVFALVCVLPALICGGLAMLGGFSSTP